MEEGTVNSSTTVFDSKTEWAERRQETKGIYAPRDGIYNQMTSHSERERFSISSLDACNNMYWIYQVLFLERPRLSGKDDRTMKC